MELLDPENPTDRYATRTVIERDPSGQETLEKTTESPGPFPWQSIFVCGYGVNRGTGQRAEQPPSTYRLSDAVMTLFDDNATLLDPEDTLRALKLDSLEAPAEEQILGQERFSTVEKGLRALFQLKPAYRLVVDSKQVRVHGPWGGLPFHALGDGYRGTAGWFLDLCRRALIADRLPSSGSPMGIVLIDEIDEHLHPAWQRQLIPMLRKRFPNLQFVGTTHSAMSIVNCEDDEILLCDLKLTISRVLTLDGPQGRTADAILRGQWFRMPHTVDDESAKILERYQDAVRSKLPENEIAPLRREVRLRFGSWVDSPLDELALEIAEELRQQMDEETLSNQRRQQIVEGAKRLRERLRQRSDPSSDLQELSQ